VSPNTQLRNALGKVAGGSDIPIDHGACIRAVGFWELHATVRQHLHVRVNGRKEMICGLT